MAHPFETAGLGLAPFKFVGCYEDRGPHVSYEGGCRVEVGSPGQPMGSCKYCGQGIAICCTVESADGKRFVVGSDCVAKTHEDYKDNNSTCFAKQVKREVARMQRDLRKARESVKIDEARELLASDCSAFEALRDEPHPNAWRAEQGDTLMDYYKWMLDNAGHSGAYDIAKRINKLLKGGK